MQPVWAYAIAAHYVPVLEILVGQFPAHVTIYGLTAQEADRLEAFTRKPR
jgi:hypothetical protein